MEEKKYIDPDEKLKFQQINLRVTQEMFDEWTEWANKHKKSLDEYIKSCVESQAIREMIINYLNELAKTKPWWEKRPHNL